MSLSNFYLFDPNIADMITSAGKNILNNIINIIDEEE